MLPDGLPERTLGWAVLDWCSKNLVNPDEYGGIKGDQWVFKPDQARFILWFYAVDETGEWLYRRAYRERAKGTGKSPMVAAIACAEFLGPTLFSHFDENGTPIGVPHHSPVIWLAAVSEAGSRHTYDYVMGMLEGPAQERYGLDIGMTRILRRGQTNNIIKQVTASPKSLEGPRPTFVVCEETQHWTPAEQGPALVGAIHRGLTKTNGRRIEVTNAPVPGQRSTAELTHEMWEDVQNGDRQAEGLLFDTFSIHVDDIYDKDQAMPALQIMYKDAPWQNLNRVWRDINDIASHSEIDSRRFFFNETVEPKALWLSEEAWDKARANVKLRPQDKIALGVRVRKHCAAIVATRLTDLAIFVLKLWERPDSPDTPRTWEVPYLDIDNSFRKLAKTHNVVYTMTSPNGFQDINVRWEADFEGEITFEAIWLDKNKQKFADAVDLFEQAVYDQRLKHDGHEALKRHVMNCFVTDVPQGKLLRTDVPFSRRYIVAAEAALLSLQGANEAILDGALQEEPSGTLYMY
jgi:hypothetical protein